jgi:hypothetical protein
MLSIAMCKGLPDRELVACGESGLIDLEKVLYVYSMIFKNA